jgi:hypothetical protein
MPHLFSSTTSDTNYSLFFGPREAAYVNDISTELFEVVINQKFNYWPIERTFTDTDELYGESDKKIARNPVEIYGLILIDDPQTITDNFTTETRRSLELYLHVDRLTEVGIFPKKGDFIEFDNQFFEIYDAYVGGKDFVHGLPNAKIGVTVKVFATRESVFAPRIEDTHDETIEHDSQNPY